MYITIYNAGDLAREELLALSNPAKKVPQEINQFFILFFGALPELLIKFRDFVSDSTLALTSV